MKRMALGTLVVAGAVMLMPRLGLAADAAAGQALFTKKCASCHGKQGEGNPAMEKMLKVTIKPLADKEVQAKSDDALKKDITEGVGKMKAVSGLSPDDVANVIAHVRAIK